MPQATFKVAELCRYCTHIRIIVLQLYIYTVYMHVRHVRSQAAFVFLLEGLRSVAQQAL